MANPGRSARVWRFLGVALIALTLLLLARVARAGEAAPLPGAASSSPSPHAVAALVAAAD